MMYSDPVELLPEEPAAPWWLEDIEDYLELLHGDAVTLCEQHCKKPDVEQKVSVYGNPKVCPGCLTVFHQTKRGGSEPCPFCHSPLHFSIG